MLAALKKKRVYGWFITMCFVYVIHVKDVLKFSLKGKMNTDVIKSFTAPLLPYI